MRNPSNLNLVPAGNFADNFFLRIALGGQIPHFDADSIQFEEAVMIKIEQNATVIRDTQMQASIPLRSNGFDWCWRKCLHCLSHVRTLSNSVLRMPQLYDWAQSHI